MPTLKRVLLTKSYVRTFSLVWKEAAAKSLDTHRGELGVKSIKHLGYSEFYRDSALKPKRREHVRAYNLVPSDAMHLVWHP